MNVIKVENISKKYNINFCSNSNRTLRDIFSNIAKNSISAINNFNNKREEYWALRGVSFNVRSNEIIGIIGPNGAGKSTLLKILSQITPPTKGRVTIRGRAASLLEVGTGFHPELSGYENIFLNSSILGINKSETISKLDKIIKFAGIRRFINTPIKRYSTGMAVRLAFAIAAHLNSKILLIDEVLAVGDIEFQKKCLGKMDEIARGKNRTIIFVSHNLEAVRQLCTSCIYLNKGKILDIGETNKVISSYLDKQNVVNDFLIKNIKSEGSGECKICNFGINDSKTKFAINKIFTGQDVEFKIDYHTNKKNIDLLKRINFKILFFTPSQKFVLGLSSNFSENKIELLSNKGKIFCRVPEFPLLAGIYKIKLAIWAENILLDRLEPEQNIYVRYKELNNSNYSTFFTEPGATTKQVWKIKN